MRIIPDFSPETMKATRSQADLIQNFRELLYQGILSITIDGKTKIFHDKTEFMQYLSTNPDLQRKLMENTNTGGKLHPRKIKKSIFFQQPQKQIVKQT